MSHYKWIFFVETPLFNKLLEYTFIHSYIHGLFFLIAVSDHASKCQPCQYTHTHTHDMPTIIQLGSLQDSTFLLMQWKQENAVQNLMHLLSRAILFFSMLSSSGEIESFEEANHGFEEANHG